MNTASIKQQKPADQSWIDESGKSIPYNRTTQTEKLREKLAFKVFQQASKINQMLKEYKKMVREASQAYVASFVSESKGGAVTEKGNYTWYNFDESIRIEVDAQESIRFDDLTIVQAKEKLMSFIGSAVKGEDFVIALISDAFQNTKGRLDVKKVLSLRKHRQRIKSPVYHEAMDLIDNAIRYRDSKTYYRVAVRDSNGEYQTIDLNLSSISEDDGK